MRLLPALALLQLGCASNLSDAVRELETGRPDQAERAFRRIEPELAGARDAERARYALYRGLTHLALGDAREAGRWLSAAKHAAEHDLALLSAAEHGRLRAAWRSLGRMPGDDR